MKNDTAQALSSWSVLNLTLRTMDAEPALLALLKAEQKGKRRLMFLLRIHSRYNLLRARRERAELLMVGQVQHKKGGASWKARARGNKRVSLMSS